MKRLLVILPAWFLLPVWFLLPAPTAHAASFQVHMSGYAFSPAQLSVKVGDTVTWTNHDQAPHNAVVTAGPARFESPMLSTGQSWSFTISQAGTYSYYCSVHPDMRAQLTAAAPAVVNQPPAATTTSTTKKPTTTPRSTKSAGAAAPAPPPAVDTTTSDSMPDSADPADPVVAVAQPAPASGPTLDPLLLVAGVVAAVATLCLLLISSRPTSS